MTATERTALRRSFLLIAEHDSCERGDAQVVLSLLDVLETSERGTSVLRAAGHRLLQDAGTIEGKAPEALVLLPVSSLRQLRSAMQATAE